MAEYRDGVTFRCPSILNLTQKGAFKALPDSPHHIILELFPESELTLQYIKHMAHICTRTEELVWDLSYEHYVAYKIAPLRLQKLIWFIVAHRLRMVSLRSSNSEESAPEDIDPNSHAIHPLDMLDISCPVDQFDIISFAGYTNSLIGSERNIVHIAMLFPLVAYLYDNECPVEFLSDLERYKEWRWGVNQTWTELVKIDPFGLEFDRLMIEGTVFFANASQLEDKVISTVHRADQRWFDNYLSENVGKFGIVDYSDVLTGQSLRARRRWNLYYVKEEVLEDEDAPMEETMYDFVESEEEPEPEGEDEEEFEPEEEEDSDDDDFEMMDDEDMHDI